MIESLPRGWTIVSIGEIATVGSGVGFPTSMQGRKDGTYPFYKVADLSTAVRDFRGDLRTARNYVNGDDVKNLRGTLVPEGSIAFAKIGEAIKLNRRAVVRLSGLVDNNVMFVVPTLVELQRYVYCFLRTVDFGPISRSTTVPSLRKGDVEDLKIRLPPLNEQKRIADKLDRLLAAVDACKARLDAIPAILKGFRQSVLAAAVSGELTEEWEAGQTSHKVWQEARFGDLVVNHDNKRVPVKLEERKQRPGEYPYYGAFGVIDCIDDFRYDGTYLLVAEDGKNLESRDRPITNMATGKFWVNNHAHVVQAKDEVELAYLQICLNSPTLDLAPFLTGIDQVKLTRAAMDRIPIALPSLDEQKEIVRRVDSMFSIAEKATSQVDAAAARVEKLTQSLFAKAFRGELVPQDSNDEPAEQLLARICTEADDLKRQVRARARRIQPSSSAQRRARRVASNA